MAPTTEKAGYHTESDSMPDSRTLAGADEAAASPGAGRCSSSSSSSSHHNNTDDGGDGGGGGKKDDDDDAEHSPPHQQQQQQQQKPEYLHGFRMFRVVAATTITMLLTMLDISILSTAIPRITSDFHRLEDVGWYTGVYQLASSAVQPLTGKFYAHLSTKWTFLACFSVFEVGSLICALATSSTVFIVGRAVAGVGCSGLANGAFIMLASVAPVDKRPMYTGVMMGVGQIGILLGPIIGGVFTEYVTWRWCFWINLPCGAITGALLVLTDIPEQERDSSSSSSSSSRVQTLRDLLRHLDLVGFALFAPAAVMFLMALQLGPQTTSSSHDEGWSSPTVIGLLAGSAACAAAFCLWERGRGDDAAMIPPSMVRRRVVWASALNFSCLMGVTFCGGTFMPIYLQAARGLSPLMSGVYALPGVLTQIFFIVLSGALVTKMGTYMLWVLFAGAAMAVGCGLMSTWTPTTGLGMLFGYQILYGGRGAASQMGMVAIQTALPPSQTAAGVSFLVFAQNLSAAVFLVASGAVFRSALAASLARGAPSVDPGAALAAGGSAAAVRGLVGGDSEKEELEGVLLAYAAGFRAVCYLLVALSLVVVASGLGMGWVRLGAAAAAGGAVVVDEEEARREGDDGDGKMVAKGAAVCK